MNDTTRPFGWLLIVASVLMVLAMLHHPRSTHSMNTISGLGGDLVHVIMLLVLWTILLGLIGLCLRLGIRRPLVLAGLVAFVLSTVLHTGAGVINGFVVPALASRDAAVDHELFVLLWESNQSLARLGAYATAVALMLWGLVLLRTKSWFQRLLGVLGMVTGVLTGAVLISGHLHMDLHGAQIIYGAHGLWFLLVGVWMAMNKETNA